MKDEQLGGQCADLGLIPGPWMFDVIFHTLLIDKLRLLGVSGFLLHWIANFLIG